MLVARAFKNSQPTDGESRVIYGTGHPAARGTIGFRPLPQLEDEPANEFCLAPASGKACHAAGPADAELRRGRPSSTWWYKRFLGVRVQRPRFYPMHDPDTAIPRIFSYQILGMQNPEQRLAV